MPMWQSEGWTNWGWGEAGGIASAKWYEIGVLWRVSFLAGEILVARDGIVDGDLGGLAQPQWIGDGIW